MTAPGRDSPIDRVDAFDRRLGTVKRGEVLELGANFRTVHVFLLSPDGALILQQLAPTRDRHAGRWGSSVAAYLHAGETYEHAAKRRLDEELGLRSQLEHVGRTRMLDERSWKFVALYRGIDGRAHVREPDHVARLRAWPVAELEREVRLRPHLFTPTFLHLYMTLPWRPAKLRAS